MICNRCRYYDPETGECRKKQEPTGPKESCEVWRDWEENDEIT